MRLLFCSLPHFHQRLIYWEELGYGGVEHSSIIYSVNKKLIVATIYGVLIWAGTMLSVFYVLSFLVFILNPVKLVIIIHILEMRKLSRKEMK